MLAGGGRAWIGSWTSTGFNPRPSSRPTWSTGPNLHLASPSSPPPGSPIGPHRRRDAALQDPRRNRELRLQPRRGPEPPGDRPPGHRSPQRSVRGGRDPPGDRGAVRSVPPVRLRAPVDRPVQEDPPAPPPPAGPGPL